MTDSWHPYTKAIHSGELKPPVSGAVTMPIFQSANYVFDGEGGYNEVRYIRLNNTPNHVVLNHKIAALEGGEACTVSSSGMAAISTALLTAVGPGEHLLIQENLYGGTFHFVTHDFLKMGRRISFFSPDNRDSLERHLTPTTKAIYVESLSNPLLYAFDFSELIQFAKSHDLLTMIDNTIPSPVNFNPIKQGFDVVLHSATKYLNGHNDIVAGATIGSQKFIREVMTLQNHLGGTLDPHACFLLHRGIKTLGIRVKQQNATALSIAQFLEKHPHVRHVLYPGLESHPHHAFVKKYFNGFGGMLAFAYKGAIDRLDDSLKKMQLAYLAPSLGGTETLVTRPRTTTHASLSKEDCEKLGISDDLVRVSVGLEDAHDLIADFQAALDR